MFKIAGSSQLGFSTIKMLVLITLFFGIIGLISILNPKNILASISSPISGPISGPITPSPTPTPYPSVSPSPVPATNPSVDSFSLINSKTDQIIPGYKKLGSFTIIRLSRLPAKKLNIKANISPQIVNRVNFNTEVSKLFKGKKIKTLVSSDYSYPYSVFGDQKGDFKNWTPSAYTVYKISATAQINNSSSNTKIITIFVLP